MKIVFLIFLSLSVLSASQRSSLRSKLPPIFYASGNGTVGYAEVFGAGTEELPSGMDPNNPPIDLTDQRKFSIAITNRFLDPDGVHVQTMQYWAYHAVPIFSDKGVVTRELYKWDWVTCSASNVITESYRTGSHTVERIYSPVLEKIHAGPYPFGATIGDKFYFRTIIQNPETKEVIRASKPIQVKLTGGWSWGVDAQFRVGEFGGWLPDDQPFQD